MCLTHTVIVTKCACAQRTGNSSAPRTHVSIKHALSGEKKKGELGVKRVCVGMLTYISMHASNVCMECMRVCVGTTEDFEKSAVRVDTCACLRKPRHKTREDILSLSISNTFSLANTFSLSLSLSLSIRGGERVRQ